MALDVVLSSLKSTAVTTYACHATLPIGQCIRVIRINPGGAGLSTFSVTRRTQQRLADGGQEGDADDVECARAAE